MPPNSTIYDLIVIGAGPAGACAAAEGARLGLSVALIEKHRLPRHKTCGGGMPMTVGQEVRDLAPDSFVESDVRYMRHSFNFQDAVLGEVNPPGCDREVSLWMAQRHRFDHELALRAVRFGASLLDGMPVEGLAARNGGVEVSAGSESYSARYVIGADGANGVTARCAGLRKNRVLAIGMEAEAPHPWGQGSPELRRDTLHLDYGAVRNGYAWVFPKDDHLNVGAGLFRPRRSDGRGEAGIGDELRRAILGYLDSLGVVYERDSLRFHSHPLPLWNGKEPLQTADGRILLAGDSAGMINPLFGDGILHAVRSGILAAQCLAEERGAEYTNRLHSEVAPNFEAARRLAGPFYQFAPLVYRQIVRRPNATRAAARLLAGDALFTDATRRALGVIKRSMSLRARATWAP